MSNRLQGKIAIVTGSSSGIGRSIALAYAKEGASVVCADLKREARPGVPDETLVNTDEEIVKNGGESIFVQTNVSLARDVETLVERAVERFGRVDILVNNAGISVESRRAPLLVHETSEEDWDITMAINTKSVFLGCKYVIAQMLKQGLHSSGHRGWIINMSSVLGLEAFRNTVAYCASKAAVASITRQVALDYGSYRIHSNCICPGFVQTAIFADTITNYSASEIEALHPLGLGTPQDIVGAAVFLASGDAHWISGVSLPVDGGYMCGK